MRQLVPTAPQVNYTKPTATDNVDTSVTVNCTPASGTKFALEDTTVSCSATDNSGNKATSTFKVTVVPPPPQDTTPPETIIDSGLSGTVSTSSASFAFSSSDEAGSTFQCQLDPLESAPASCTSPKAYSGLMAGTEYTFSVWATDASGNTDATPATSTLRQDNRDTDGDTLENWEDDCIAEAEPASNGRCPLPVGPFPGIRFTPKVGVAAVPSKIMTATGVQDLYNTYMKSAYHGADDSVDFVVQTKLDWPETMKNPAVKPTLAQMADPGWSGYIWNDPTHPDYAELTEIDKMLAAPCVQDGKCKVSINIGTGATGGSNQPAFMLNDGLAWEGPGSGTYIRVKWYKQEARDYAEAFTLAALQRFDDGGISRVKLNEYFPGSVKPADWTASGGQDAYEDGYYAYAQDVIAGAPRDANGERVALYQTNPMANSDAFTPQQISSLMLGVADSNQKQFNESSTKTYRPGLHGVVPMCAPLDAVPFRNGYRATWDGTPNPWGYTNGQTVTVTVAHVAWYHGNLGLSPMDQEFITKPGIPTEQFQAAMDLLGPGGTWHDQWGGVAYEK